MPLTALEELILLYVFANLAFPLPWQPIEFRGLDKIDMFDRGLLKEHFYKPFVKISAVRYTSRRKGVKILISFV